MKSPRPRSVFPWFALLLAIAAGGPLAAAPGATAIDLPLLLDLPGDLAPVRYTPGSLDRSASIQARAELLTREFGRSGFQANAIVLFVLSPEDWTLAKLPAPYGLPCRLGVEALVVPAWANETVVRLVRDDLGGELPLPRGTPLLATPAEAGALAVSDLVAQLELAGLLVRRAGLTGDRPWIEGLVTHLVARLAWDKFEPGRMQEIAAIFDRLSVNSPDRGPHALESWSPELAPRQRYWFDARFLRAADLMLQEKKPRALWRMLAKAVEKKEPLTEALLLDEFPQLAAWRAENFAPAP
ncbi:MAG: hypothetical protein AB7G12_07890 [Thermoanaerobaculia bacterium]